MDMIKIVILCVLATLMITLLRKQIPEISIYIGITVGIVLFMLIGSKLSSAISVLKYFSEKAQMDDIYLSTIIKIIGIAYISEFGAEICRDAGESSIASKIELSAKVLIFMISLPILAALLDTIIRLIP